jgi:Fur family peroxide stress response transcriptional regulator
MEKKLRHSHQRDMIYNYLLSSKEHPSAEMIYEDLKKVEPTLSLGTVYRNLKLLEDLGSVRRVTTLNNVERYDAFTDDHMHFVCEDCGRVIDLPDFDDSIIKKSFSSQFDGDVKWVKIIVGGKCSICRSKMN